MVLALGKAEAYMSAARTLSVLRFLDVLLVLAALAAYGGVLATAARMGARSVQAAGWSVCNTPVRGVLVLSVCALAVFVARVAWYMLRCVAGMLAAVHRARAPSIDAALSGVQVGMGRADACVCAFMLALGLVALVCVEHVGECSGGRAGGDMVKQAIDTAVCLLVLPCVVGACAGVLALVGPRRARPYSIAASEDVFRARVQLTPAVRCKALVWAGAGVCVLCSCACALGYSMHLHHESGGVCDATCAAQVLFNHVKRVSGLGCSKVLQRCVNWWLFGEESPPCCRAHLRDMTIFTSRLLAAHNITHWLGGGSLIGALRHGDVVPWDTDADIAILVKSEDEDDGWNALLEEKLKALDPNGVRGSYFLSGGNLIKHGFRVWYSPGNWNHVDVHPMVLPDAAAGDVLPTALCKFGPARLPCPRHPLPYLQRFLKMRRHELHTLLEPNFKHCVNRRLCPRPSDRARIRSGIVATMRALNATGDPTLLGLLAR